MSPVMITDSEEIDLIFAELERGAPVTDVHQLDDDGDFLADPEFDEAPPRRRFDFEEGSHDDAADDDAGETYYEPAPPTPGGLERMTGLVAALSLPLWSAMLQGAFLETLAQQVLPLVTIVAFVLGGLISSHGPRAVAQAAGVWFGGRAVDQFAAEHLRSLMRRGRRLVYAGAALQMVISAVTVLQNLDAPAQIGPAVASALGGLLLAVLLAELGFGTAEHWVESDANE